MRILPITVLAVAALGFTLAQAADVYRWVDEAGITHYADAPPNNKQYQRVNVRTGSIETDTTQADTEADKAKAEEAEAQAAAAARAERCRIAKQNLESLRSGFAMIPGEDGQARSLTAEELQQQLELNQNAVDQSCTSP